MISKNAHPIAMVTIQSPYTLDSYSINRLMSWLRMVADNLPDINLTEMDEVSYRLEWSPFMYKDSEGLEPNYRD